MKRRFSLIVATLVLLAGLLLLGGRAYFTEGAESAADKPASSVARISPGRDSDTATRKTRARQPAEKSSLTKRMLSGERVNLTLSITQLEQFLEKQGRTAESLLTAARLGGAEGTAYLEEAARRFPDHPMVQFELFNQAPDPALKLAALERLRKVDPNNALADLLAASLRFKLGDRQQAVADLDQASGHDRFDSYAESFRSQSEAAFSIAGLSTTDARAVSLLSLSCQELSSLREISSGVDEASLAARIAGDDKGARDLLEAGLATAQRIRNTAPNLIQELVGLSMEMKLLKSAAPDDVLPPYHTTAAQALADLTTRKESISALAATSNMRLQQATEEELRCYFETASENGEIQAMQDLTAGQK